MTGADVGSGTVDFKKHAKNNVAWKVGLGTKYAVNQNIALDLRYQYADLGKIATSTGVGSGTVNGVPVAGTAPVKNGKLRAHEFLLGIAYKF